MQKISFFDVKNYMDINSEEFYISPSKVIHDPKYHEEGELTLIK